ncbi:hypothetical protein HHK36_031003 [Tetracentron sinense]|uniref:Prolyl 4-hydroxylase 9 n=1 Tax=Tetracentron sinense TaxID=13715 RepID=A0A835D182_TETSI|nr:hypothetical protein HHK36_031003 [Tetracentron sinense]
MKGKGKGSWGLGTKLGFPAVFLSCSVFFLAGFFGSELLSQDISGIRPRPRLLELVDEEKYESMSHGETGESSIASIPFQVLSWKPRALYFPEFATVDQCKSIIKKAKLNLRPSTLALRKGETAENTKGIRTRYLLSTRVFVIANKIFFSLK